MIKIQALRRAFYNGEIIKAGQIINITSNKVPSWAKKIGGKTTDDDTVKTPKKDETETTAGEQKQILTPDHTEVKSEDTAKEEETETADGKEVIVAGDGGVHPIPEDGTKPAEENIPEDLSGKTEAEILAILDELITKGIEIGVMIENVEKKTPVEQIIELRKLIEEKKQ